MARSKTVTAAGGIVIDTSDFRDLARDIRRGKDVAAKEFKKGMREAGLLVAAEAKTRASFSPRIASTIKVRARGAAIEVVAGAPDVPEAALLELGNRGHGKVERVKKEGGTFRHPVFQTDVNPDTWVTQEMRPFLTPALEAKEQEAVRLIGRAVDTWLRSSGFQ